MDTVVSLVFIDNYDELTQGMEEIQPLMDAVISRKLNAMGQKAGGIIKKFERDKYIFLFSTEKLDYFKETNFDILKEIRKLDMGNKIPITLSMGIGWSGATLAQNMEYARTAIDLALGRGGDQAVIKDADSYQFFGGTVKSVSINNRVRARVKAYALGEMIEEAGSVMIMGHRNADLDCLGAAVGVHAIVRSFGKPCHIVLDSIPSNIKLLCERLPEYKEFSENTFITSQRGMKLRYGNVLLIITDCHRPSMLECSELLQKADKIVVFDHHRKSTEYIKGAVLTYHEPYASSTCEIVTEMLPYFKTDVKLEPVVADALLSGITLDTKNFAFKTGAKTFDAAAYLIKNGADSIRVRMLFQNDIKSYNAKSEAVNSAERYRDSMAIAVCPSDGENPLITAAQAADDLLNISGVAASFVLCHHEETVHISARSLGDVNVQMILEKLGGGGHQTVAGTQLTGFTLEEAETALKKVLDEFLS